uniref:uncharacterized protein LOC120335058 n=1 Tax=Styela clava TaxID=7725 RepID=UPI00193A5F3C|nr:uncharacterized protein LOC120335058 [Styela clava]
MSDRLEDVIRGCVRQFASTVDFTTFAQSGNGLALSVQDVTTVIENHRLSVEEQKKKLFWLWVERNRSNATAQRIRNLVTQYYEVEQQTASPHVGRLEDISQDVAKTTDSYLQQIENVSSQRSGSDILLTWDEVSDSNILYNIEIFCDDVKLGETHTTEVPQYRMKSPTLGKTYRFQVWAKDEWGDIGVKTQSKNVIKVENIKVAGGSMRLNECKVTFPSGTFTKQTKVWMSAGTVNSICPEEYIGITPVFNISAESEFLKDAIVQIQSWCIGLEKDKIDILHFSSKTDWDIIKPDRITEDNSIEFRSREFSPVTVAIQWLQWLLDMPGQQTTNFYGDVNVAGNMHMMRQRYNILQPLQDEQNEHDEAGAVGGNQETESSDGGSNGVDRVALVYRETIAISGKTISSTGTSYLLFTFTEFSIRYGDSEIIYNVNKCLGDRVYEGRIVTLDNFGKPITQDKLAVKLRTINRSLSKEEIDEKYRNEIENAIKLLAHDNVARYVRHRSCYLSNEPTVVIVTDLCNHEKLETHLPGFSVEDKKILLLQLCHGLNHIHQTKPKPIAHRDLKPSNVLLSLDGKHIKIIDFGISKEFALDENNTITKSTGFSGSYGWVASEMCSDDRSKEFEAWVKADIYSLGLLIYFIFTDGKHPYQGSPASRHAKIENKEQPDFSAIENDEQFHDRYLLKELLKTMLSHKPDARPGITEILQHCIIWNDEKKMNFISVCSEYLQEIPEGEKRKKIESNGTVEQKMAYVHIKSIDSIQSRKLREDEKIALKKIYTILKKDWLKLIKEELEDPRNKSYKNSFTELVRYIRNTHAHFKEKSEKMKSKLGSRNRGMWKFIASNFPEFFPHLFHLLKNELKGDDKEKYLAEANIRELTKNNETIDDMINNYFSFAVMSMIMVVLVSFILGRSG